ncbi:MAG: hypothetical protein Q8O88_00375 [bacterium]|nr:hypothetical protein [bacterium]
MKRNLEMFILGLIVGGVLTVLFYTYEICPSLIVDWQNKAIENRVGEFYVDDNGYTRFRFLTEREN